MSMYNDMAMLIWQCIFIYFKHFTHLFPNTQIMQFQCDDIWRRVDQLNFRFGDELTNRPRQRDDQGDELTCNRGGQIQLIFMNILIES